MEHEIILNKDDPMVKHYIESIKKGEPWRDMYFTSCEPVLIDNETCLKFIYRQIGEIKEKWIDVTELSDSRKKEMEINSGRIRYGDFIIIER